MNVTSSTARASTAAAVVSPGSADDTLPARVRLGSAGSNARRRRRRNLIRSDHEPPSWEVRALSPLAIIAVWQSVSVIGWLPQDVLAPPSRVLSTLGSLISDGTLTTALSVSVQRERSRCSGVANRSVRPTGFSSRPCRGCASTS